MCNLYGLDKGQDAIRKAFEVERDETGSLPPLPAIFPDQMAPVVRLADGARALAMMRWGFPSPTSKGTQHPVTNVRNVKSPCWRPWLKPEQRCLVPVSSFSEYADTKPRKTPVWFALDEDRPLFAFAAAVKGHDGREWSGAGRSVEGGVQVNASGASKDDVGGLRAGTVG